MVDAWIRQRIQPLLTQKSSTKTESLPTQKYQWNYFHGWQMDSLAHTAPVDLEIINENWVVVDSEIVNKTASMADAWIRQRTQPLLSHKLSTKTESLPTQKLSMKLLSWLTHGFISSYNLYWLRNHQWKLSRYWPLSIQKSAATMESLLALLCFLLGVY